MIATPDILTSHGSTTTDAVRSGVGGRLESFKAEGVTVHHCDCMELMRATPDGAFDLAIVDPPYGIGINMNQGRRKGDVIKHARKTWDASPPAAEYWNELRRVSREQIVWGANNFGWIPPHNGWVVWDKDITGDVGFSRAELAYNSTISVVDMVRIRAQSGAETYTNKIHPTQKPVALYAWLLSNYAKRGQRVLDTHFGSGSIAIAARNFGCELVACEIDADYFAASTARIARDFSQQMLFPGGGSEPVGEQLDAFEHSGAPL